MRAKGYELIEGRKPEVATCAKASRTHHTPYQQGRDKTKGNNDKAHSTQPSMDQREAQKIIHKSNLHVPLNDHVPLPPIHMRKRVICQHLFFVVLNSMNAFMKYLMRK